MQSAEKLETSLKLKERCFQWKISNWVVSSLMGRITSENFAIPDLKTELTIGLCIHETNLVLLFYFGDVAGLENCSIETYILINNQKIKLLRATDIDLEEYREKSVTFAVFETLEKYDTCNELIILCEMKYGSSVPEHLISYDKKMNLNNFGKLFSDQKLCDVVLLTGNEEISAHIAVLAAVSPYFLAMFDNPNNVENKKGIVDFTNDKDVTPNNLRGFLEFIYSSKSIIELSSIVLDLLILADKFGVDQLRITCECYLCENIDEENVVDILILSDKYNCNLLKKKATTFAKMHIDAVKTSSKFDELCKIASVMRNLL